MPLLSKIRTPLLAFILLVFVVSSALAHNKVVVIPLGGDEVAKNKVIFITKDRYPGNLQGLSGADAICQADADLANSKVKGKNFKAWLGPATDPLNGGRLFVVHELPYITSMGTILANSYSDLITMNPWPFLRYSAEGLDVTETTDYDSVWTGRESDGNTNGPDCDEWRGGDPVWEEGRIFRESAVDLSTYDASTTITYCATIQYQAPRIICMEQ